MRRVALFSALMLAASWSAPHPPRRTTGGWPGPGARQRPGQAGLQRLQPVAEAGPAGHGLHGDRLQQRVRLQGRALHRSRRVPPSSSPTSPALAAARATRSSSRSSRPASRTAASPAQLDLPDDVTFWFGMVLCDNESCPEAPRSAPRTATATFRSRRGPTTSARPSWRSSSTRPAGRGSGPAT